jgi:hypothetical protein
VNHRRTTFAIAFAATVLTAGPALADGRRAPPAVVAAVPVEPAGTVISISAGFGASVAGTEDDWDQEIASEEMHLYAGFHGELSVFVGRNLVRGKEISLDLGYHGHLSVNDVDALQRHQFALVLARNDMFGLLGLGGAVLHDFGFEVFVPFVSMSVVAGCRFGPVSLSFPLGIEVPVDGSASIKTIAMLVGYSYL